MSNSGNGKRHFLDERSNVKSQKKKVGFFKSNEEDSDFDWREAVHKVEEEEGVLDEAARGQG